MGLLGKLFGGEKRNERLAAWGKSVLITNLQQEVMWELWQSMKIGVISKTDPLAKLSAEDREYVLKICGSSFRPTEFGSADALRLTVFRDLESKGYSREQSAVLVGMMFNMVGRKDL